MNKRAIKMRKLMQRTLKEKLDDTTVQVRIQQQANAVIRRELEVCLASNKRLVEENSSYERRLAYAKRQRDAALLALEMEF